jgi:hypothetical protein
VGCGHFFVPLVDKSLGLSSAQWDTAVLGEGDTTFVIIGGHHRAGTTLIWHLLRQCGDAPPCDQIISFGTNTGADFSEGLFLQDVLPTFGVGTEHLWDGMRGGSIPRGVGTYALAGEAAVHLTEENESRAAGVTKEARTRLLNQCQSGSKYCYMVLYIM